MKTCVLNRQLLAGVGVVALMAASPANAAGSPSPPAMWSWSGFYIGGHTGYGWGRDPFSDAIFAGKAPAGVPGLSSINPHGALGGFQAGVNWQAGSWVGGLEIDLSGTDVKGSSSAATGLITSPPFTEMLNATQTDRFDWVGSGRARLGYSVLPTVLLYGTAGPAWARFLETNDSFVSFSGLGASLTASTSQANPTWRFGAVAGVGVEAQLGDSNWLGRIEYLHYDFGKADTFSSTDPTAEVVTRGDLTLDVVRVALSYKLSQAAARSSGPLLVKAMPVKAAVAAPWTWSGFYIGGHAGYGWGDDPFTDPNQGTAGITLADIHSTGFVGGLQAGGNWQMGAWVGGLELDLSGTGIKGSTSGTAAVTGPPGTDTVTQTDRFELLGSARARLGYTFWPDVLLYGTGGLAWTRMVNTADENLNQPGNFFASSSATTNWEFGWAAGLGFEARLWNSNWLGRIEYLHYDFGDSGSSFEGSTVTFSSGHLTADVIRGGLSYKFDWSNPTFAPTMTAMPVKARPAPAATADWSGFYLGGHIGYGWARDPVTDAAFGGKTGLFKVSTNSNGVLGGFQAGANRQLGAFVGGLEIDVSATGIKGTSNELQVGTTDSQTDTDKFNTLGSARARAGYLATPNLLLYGTGGLAWTRLEQSSLEMSGGTPSGGTSPIWEFGWIAGAGAETRLWNTNWFLRGEYLHYDFGDSGNNFTAASGILGSPFSFATSSTTGHLTVDVVRSALSFKFN